MSMPKVDGGGFFLPFPFSHSTQVSDILNDDIVLYIHPALATGVTETRSHKLQPSTVESVDTTHSPTQQLVADT